jgi:hypothetical protein
MVDNLAPEEVNARILELAEEKERRRKRAVKIVWWLVGVRVAIALPVSLIIKAHVDQQRAHDRLVCELGNTLSGAVQRDCGQTCRQRDAGGRQCSAIAVRSWRWE